MAFCLLHKRAVSGVWKIPTEAISAKSIAIHKKRVAYPEQRKKSFFTFVLRTALSKCVDVRMREKYNILLGLELCMV